MKAAFNVAAALIIAITPPCDALQSSVPHSPPDPQLNKITIAGGDLQAQSIPLTYASSWPIWIASPDGSTVTRVPDSSFSSSGSDEDDNGGTGVEAGWVDPSSFEQLWLPMDLPPPTTSAALGLVLKDGVPRYVFPTLETILATKDGGAWHNRGLKSLPLAKTWLPFGDVPVDDLRMSCYRRPLPPLEVARKHSAGTAANGEDDAEKDEENPTKWIQVLPLTKVSDTMDLLINVLSQGPDELGNGFCYLIAPFASTSLNKGSVVPGQRVRCFLSNVETTPTSQDPDDDEAWVWSRGECDVTVHNVAPGGGSDYLPDAYKLLYDKDQCL